MSCRVESSMPARCSACMTSSFRHPSDPSATQRSHGSSLHQQTADPRTGLLGCRLPYAIGRPCHPEHHQNDRPLFCAGQSQGLGRPPRQHCARTQQQNPRAAAAAAQECVPGQAFAARLGRRRAELGVQHRPAGCQGLPAQCLIACHCLPACPPACLVVYARLCSHLPGSSLAQGWRSQRPSIEASLRRKRWELISKMLMESKPLPCRSIVRVSTCPASQERE